MIIYIILNAVILRFTYYIIKDLRKHDICCLTQTCFTDTDQILLAQYIYSQKEGWRNHYYCVRCVQCYLVKHSCVHFSLTGNFYLGRWETKCHKAKIPVLTVPLTDYVTSSSSPQRRKIQYSQSIILYYILC